MKYAKKWLALLLVSAFCVTMIAGCAEKEPMESAGNVSDLSEEKHFGVESITTSSDDSTGESTEQSAEQSTPSETSQNPGTFSGEFIVSEKKYTYNNQNLMLLHVKNDTDTHYDLTIKGKYLDADGNTIKEESQTYHAFPSGWENYFIFRPKLVFENFEYELEVKKYQVATEMDRLYSHNGEPLSTYAELTYSKELVWDRGYQNTVRLCLEYELINHHESVPLAVELHMLILDEQGNIYLTDWEAAEAMGFVDPVSGTQADPIGGEDDGKARCSLKVQPADAEQTIPENVQGKCTIIFAIVDVINGIVGREIYG